MRVDSRVPKILRKGVPMRLTRFGSALLVSSLLGGVSGISRAATFTVTNINDSGAGSLRQAITDANAAGGADTIEFNIVGSGVHTIVPASAPPHITRRDHTHRRDTAT